MLDNVLTDETRGTLGQKRIDLLKEWDFQKTSVEHSGKKIVLPAEPGLMDHETAAKHLLKLAKEENTLVDVTETIACFPHDGLVAITKAMAHLFGWASPTPTPSFFGPVPPDIITVQTSYNEFAQVPMGAFTVPAIPDEYRINVGMNFNAKSPHAYISAQVPRKFERIVRMIGKTARDILKTDSIYKGKAIKLHTNSNYEVDYSQQPHFFYSGAVSEADLHLNADVFAAVNTSILAPIKHMERCQRAGVPLKRGVLLEGKYGVGKTLISTITSKIAVMNDWTFILVEEVRALRSALELAKKFEPCIVFAEDLDRAVTLDRDDVANDILNTLDGVLSKDSKVMVVFTTNHIEKISKAMLRPGRLDAVITVSPPDAKTCEALIRYYSRGLVSVSEDISATCALMEGQIPATIREVVERSKLTAIMRTASDEELRITAQDLLVTAKQLSHHLTLLNTPVDEASDADKFFGAYRTMVAGAFVGEQLSNLATSDEVDEVKDVVREVGNVTVKKVSSIVPSEEKNLQVAEKGTVMGLRKVGLV